MAKGHILIVDGNDDVATGIRDVLLDEGYSVSRATEGWQALSLAIQESPDVILMDIWLPGMDGIEALGHIQKLSLAPNVIIMSTHGNIETAVTAMQQGAFDYIQKPAPPAEILHPISRALQARDVGQNMRLLHHPQPDIAEGVIHISQTAVLKQQIQQLATDDTPIFIQAESGCEQAPMAHLIHQKSARSKAAFITYPCLHKKRHVLTRQLFGTANADRGQASLPMKSAFEEANGGTLYLDTIDALPIQVQQELVKVLITHQIQRRQGSIPIPISVRLIASFTKPLDQLLVQQRLLPELTALFHPSVVMIPPLRTRKADLSELTHHVLQYLAVRYKSRPKRLDDDVMTMLREYDWPGNYEEFKCFLEAAFRSATRHHITRYHFILPRQHASDVHRHRPSHRNLRSLAARQKTLCRSAVLYGQGLQSGIKTGLVLSPLPPNSGIVFSNITTGERIPASIEYVESTEFSTSLRKGRFTSRTIEHLLSALHAYRISNLLVKITDEVPIMDGSASAFCQLIEQAGVREQTEYLEEFVVTRCLHIGTIQPEAKYLLVEPYNGLRITYRLHYPRPLGIQEFTYEYLGAYSYRHEIAPARTFSFVSDIEKMHNLDLLAGGRLNNAILLDGEKIVNNTQLRFPEECARHKVLDLMGDLYLLGKPIKGYIRANLTGHTENVALVQKLYGAMRNRQ